MSFEHLRLPDKVQLCLIVGVTIYDSSANNETELFQDGATRLHTWPGADLFPQCRYVANTAKVVPSKYR